MKVKVHRHWDGIEIPQRHLLWASPSLLLSVHSLPSGESTYTQHSDVMSGQSLLFGRVD